MEYTIKDVAKLTGLTAYTLRYYENEGLIPNLKRTNSGIRHYSDTDICWINLICCLKNSGMPIKNIKEFMNLCLSGSDTCEDRKELLIKHREYIIDQIAKLNCSLQTINYKIEHYDEVGIFHIDSDKKCE